MELSVEDKNETKKVKLRPDLYDSQSTFLYICLKISSNDYYT